MGKKTLPIALPEFVVPPLLSPIVFEPFLRNFRQTGLKSGHDKPIAVDPLPP